MHALLLTRAIMDVVHQKLHRARRSCKHRLTPGNQTMVQLLPCNLNGKDTVSTWMQDVTAACNQGVADLGSGCHRAMTSWPFSVGSTMAAPFSVCSRSNATFGRPYRNSIIWTQSLSRALDTQILCVAGAFAGRNGRTKRSRAASHAPSQRGARCIANRRESASHCS